MVPRRKERDGESKRFLKELIKGVVYGRRAGDDVEESHTCGCENTRRQLYKCIAAFLTR
jgi:hypothetical protein